MAELYRHYDGSGALMYVGVSISTAARLAQHRGHSRWFNNIARVEIEKYESREAALLAEKAAIESEQPLWNVHHKLTPKEAEARAKPSEIARDTLISRFVRFKALYRVNDVATELGLSSEHVRFLISSGRLSATDIPNKSGTSRKYVTGFQLISFLETEPQP